MSLNEFKEIQLNTDAFKQLATPLKALLVDYYGDWDNAHELVQNDTSKEAAWVHAYLHRKEGDESNANYWYINAGKQFYHGGLTEEWQEISNQLLR